MQPIQLSKATLSRIPVYYRIVRRAAENGIPYISSEEVGLQAGVAGAQVRKDLQGFPAKGRPSAGYSAEVLCEQLEHFLGVDDRREAALVGVGNLGRALALFPGFPALGVSISLLFDSDPAVVGTKVAGIRVHPAAEISRYVRRLALRIGIIATPAAAAQEAADALVAGGVTAIWNFAPVRLRVPPGVFIRNEDLSAGLAVVSAMAGGNTPSPVLSEPVE